MSDILDLKCFAIDGDFVYRDHWVSPGFHVDACMYKPEHQTFFGICEEKYTDNESEKTRIIIGSYYNDRCKFLKLSDNDKILPYVYVVFHDGHATYAPFKVTTQRMVTLNQRCTSGNMIYSIPDTEKFNEAKVEIGDLETCDNTHLGRLFNELDNFLSSTTILNRQLYFDFEYVLAWIASEFHGELFIEEKMWNIN